MRNGVLSVIFAALAVGCIATPAQARHDGQSLDRILPQIREHHPGTLYDAEGPFIGPDGQQHYRIKWMTPEGRVIWFDADARTGRVNNNDRGDDRGFFNGPSDGGGPDSDRGSNREHRDRFGDGNDGGNPFDGGNDNRGRHHRGDDGDGNGGGGNGDWRSRHGNNDGGGFMGWPGGNGGERHRGHGHDN